MNKLVFAAFVAFWAMVVAIALVAVLTPDTRPQTAVPPVDDADALPRFSMAEVARHDSLESCWKVINGKVYDVTDYIPEHPAPPEVMLEWCGRESTRAMETKGIGRPHRSSTWRMLEGYLIGEIAEE